MKLSDIKGERVFDVLAVIIGPVVSIANDEGVSRMFRREECPEGMTPWQFYLGKLGDCLPRLMDDHRDDVVSIMSTINDCTPEEYVENLSMPKLFADVIEVATDQQFMAFFT